VIDQYAAHQFDEYNFPIGAITPQGMPKSQHLEGKITRIAYTNPEGRSGLEIYRNYESSLKRAGFEQVFTCSGDACGTARFRLSNDWADGLDRVERPGFASAISLQKKQTNWNGLKLNEPYYS
jgi:hypothetical protein